MDFSKFSVAPNTEQIKSFFLIVGPVATALLIQHGWTPSAAATFMDNALLSAPFLAMIGAAIWGLKKNTRTAIQDRAAVPGTFVVTDPAAAAANPNPNVIDGAKLKQILPQVVAATTADPKA